MRKVLVFLLATVMTLSLGIPGAAFGFETPEQLPQMKQGIYILIGVAVLLLILAVVLTAAKPFSRRKKSAVRRSTAVFSYLAVAISAGILVLSYGTYRQEQTSLSAPPMTEPVSTEAMAPVETEQMMPPETGEETTTAPTEDPRLSFQPIRTEVGDPANWGVRWEIFEGDEKVESYERPDPISFGPGEEYFALPGVATFRGNNYRNSPSYGTAKVENKTLRQVWSHPMGSLNKWGGCAWTGQPLVVQWPAKTRGIMNIYDSKKTKENLVEVIYATLDGNIHFYDMEDGKPTRDSIKIGLNFKGAGALDPRGYPILYAGSGLYVNGKGPRMHIISLIDGSVLYEYGNKDPLAQRDWTAFDSSPLVDAESDTLIWPGESGILYTIKLNTKFDPVAGVVSVDPEPPVKTRYATDYSDKGRYLGYESSASIVDHYLYVSENGGMFYCVDLNTMELVWAQDTKDDSNSSPVFEWSDDGSTGYIYTAPSLHWTAEKDAGSVSMYKLDAKTGEILWEVSRDCVTVEHVSGGVQSTPLIGKDGTDIEGMIIYIVARVPKAYDGTMVALDRKTGEVIWEISTRNYAWSSPVPFYTEDGRAYIAFCNASGKLRLVDGATGEILYALGFDQTTEASPAVFDNMMVLGTREALYGIEIS